MNTDYRERGYFRIDGFLDTVDVVVLRSIALKFHAAWQRANPAFYASSAVNSAYLTGTRYLDAADRQQLFNCIGSTKIARVLAGVIDGTPLFMNTQLFFNPVNPQQKNYWHRDPQYHLSPEQQQCLLVDGGEVVHCRLALADEPGVELVPGSHRRWDSDEELAVRMQTGGRQNSENLASSVAVALRAGDLLVFSANMIHRGLYGMDRLALDLLFANTRADVAAFIEADCLPDQEMLDAVEDPRVFIASIQELRKRQA